MNSNWSYSPETVKLGSDSVTLTFDLWPWPFAWTLLWSLVITPENFMMIGWWEHSQKGVTDRRTDRRTDGQTENTICRAAWSQLKITLQNRWIIKHSTVNHILIYHIQYHLYWKYTQSQSHYYKNKLSINHWYPNLKNDIFCNLASDNRTILLNYYDCPIALM